MAVHVIKVPDVGEGIAEVELVEWHVQPGDAVVEDQALADVMTDKASVEIPSPVAGRVVALGGEVGQTIAVGSELIRIELHDGDIAAAPALQMKATPARPEAPAPGPALAVHAPPAEPPVRVATQATPVRAAPSVSDKPIASPSVRRRAWELGADLHQVRGSGAGGRILHADLEGAARSSAAPTGMRYTERSGEEAVRVIGLRRKIAQKMQESKRRIPHFTYVEEVDVTELEALRARLNKKWGETRGRLTVLPFLMRAVVLAAPQFPQLNARFDDEAGVLTRHGAVHLGIATQTANGLLVPVVRHAETLDLWAGAAEVARLAGAARAGHATRDELSGSTITITSLGALGGIVSTPVINHPEVAIIGVNRIVEKPVVRNGAIVVRQTMNLSSSFDHRVIDGQVAAEFVQALRACLECPALLFVE